jgi:hypothetical protein
MTPTNVRFHGGVDIDECAPGDRMNVFSILSGKRETPTVCVSGSTCVRIRDSATHAFDYEHLNVSTTTLPAVNSTTTIPAGTFLGTVQGGSSLHLQEAIGIAGTAYRFNPQRPNALDFDHSGSPTFTLTSISGASNQSIILLPESSTYPDGQQSTPTAFRQRNGTYYVKGNVDVLVAASGGSGGTSDRGFRYYVCRLRRSLRELQHRFMQPRTGRGNTGDFWTTYLGRNRPASPISPRT